MAIAKPTAFISHISEEGEVARVLKEFIERKFLRSIQVFASSHDASIKLGDEWLPAIKNSVAECGLMVVICSPISVARPWINFEAGAGWVRGIPVVPMCHSGLTPAALPVPLNTLQAGSVANRADILKLFRRIALLANTDVPDCEEQEFFDKIHNFETNSSANILVKDSEFIANILKTYVGILEHCICASFLEYEKFFAENFYDIRLEDHEFTFNDIYRMFDVVLLVPLLTRKIYHQTQVIVLRIADNIRFVLSNNHLRIAPELKDLLNDFLYSLAYIDDWAEVIPIIDRNEQVKKQIIEMIKKEQCPPTRRDTANVINAVMDYYDSVVFYREWIVRYRALIVRLTGVGRSAAPAHPAGDASLWTRPATRP